MSSRIKLDRYVYKDIYPAFKAATDEKEITANINRTFLNYLAKRNLILTGDCPVAVADIGCGPCDTLIKYLTGVVFAPGFIVRATDFIPEYADAERGEELQTLASAQAKNTIKLVDFSVRAGNAIRVPHRCRIPCHVSRRGVVGCAAPDRGCGEQCSRARCRLHPLPYREHARDIPGISGALRQQCRRYRRQ